MQWKIKQNVLYTNKDTLYLQEAWSFSAHKVIQTYSKLQTYLFFWKTAIFLPVFQNYLCSIVALSELYL